MKDVFKHFNAKEVEYPFCFNINVLEKIQVKYGSISEWSEKLESDKGSEQIEALKYMIMESVNEGIDIENDERNEKRPFVDEKKVGRLLSFIDGGMLFAKTAIIESNDTGKNALTEQN